MGGTPAFRLWPGTAPAFAGFQMPFTRHSATTGGAHQGQHAADQDGEALLRDERHTQQEEEEAQAAVGTGFSQPAGPKKRGGGR